jgi:hypothetical protein
MHLHILNFKPYLKKLFLYFLLVVAMVPNRFFSQFDQLRNYNIRNGLPSSDIYSIMQDSKGFIWMTGDMGVSCFDGYKFKNFSSAEGLADNTLFGAYEDKQHRIWFRSFSGKLSWLRNDSVFSLPCNDTLVSFFRSALNNSIYVEGDTVWLGTTIGYIIKINPGWKNQHVVKMNVPGKEKYIYRINKEAILYGDHNLTATSIIEVYDRQLKKIYSVDANKQIARAPRFFAKQLPNGNLCATLNDFIFEFNNNGIKNQQRENFTFIFLANDNDGSILAATTGGVMVYDPENLKKQRIISALQGKVITGIFVDRENNVWFTTEGHGIYCITHRNFKYYTPENGLPESKITCLGIYNSKVIAGHLDASLSVFGKDTIRPFFLDHLKKKFPLKRRINDIFNHGKRAFICTGSDSYYFENQQLHPLLNIPTPFRQFCMSADSNIWALGYSRIFKYEWESFKALDTVVLPFRIDNIFEDSKGHLWLGSMEGVYTWDGKQLKQFEPDNKLLKQRIVNIKESSDHIMWIATRGSGVIIKNGSTYTHITEKEGLAGNMCRTIFTDSNTVWVGTNKGLSKIIFKNGKFFIDNFYSSNGLLNNEVNDIIKEEGKLWLAHNNGISVFEPDYAKSNTYSPPVYILRVLVNDSVFYPENTQIPLHHSQNYFNIDYIGLCYKDAGNIEYKYKMEGIDSGWTYTKYTSVKYQTLPPGSYRFIVFAKNSDGFWGDRPDTISFTISQAWWQTWWFIALLLMSTGTLTTLVFKLRLKKIKARDIEKTKLHQRIAETELHALRAQMNPHFVFNAINSVQYFITRNDPESSQKYLAKFARLIRYVVDNSSLSLIPLKTELEAINLYLELESLRFEKKFNYVLTIDKKIDTNYIHIPSMIVQPYIENAIWHGLMHKKESGSIIISLELINNNLKCVIEDDGIGRKRSAEIKSGSAGHKSLGMKLTKERLEIINQINNTNLSVEIHDLYDESGFGKGTRVELNIPLR